MKKGIDVSRFQGEIKWDRLNVDFAILRAGYGREVSQKDYYFERNYAECKRLGIPVGCYWYSYATTAEDARKEARACLEVIKGKQFEYPVYFDIEEKKQIGVANELCKAFCDEMEKVGYWVGIYSFASFLNSYICKEIKNRYAVWVAHFGVGKPNYSGDYGMWQYSDKGRMDGINANVDLDYCYLDYPAEIKKAKLNGFSDDVKPVEIKKYTVKPGDTLTAIAKQYNTTVAKLAKDNNIKNPDLIFAGQELIINANT